MAIQVREARSGPLGVEDERFILALNAACEPAVSALDVDGLALVQAAAYRTLIAELDGEPAGFLIAMRPGAPYASDNFGWFERQFERHFYIDRVAVADGARGTGVGRALYEAAGEIADALWLERVTCEVNEDPPNPESMAFHAKLGFRFLKSRKSGSGKTVAMLVRELPPS